MFTTKLTTTTDNGKVLIIFIYDDTGCYHLSDIIIQWFWKLSFFSRNMGSGQPMKCFFALSNALEGILPFSLTMFSNADVKNLVFMGSFRISDPSPVMEITSLGLFSPQYFMSRDDTTCRSLLVLSRTYWKKTQSVWNHLPFKDNRYVSKNATSTYIGDIVL